MNLMTIPSALRALFRDRALRTGANVACLLIAAIFAVAGSIFVLTGLVKWSGALGALLRFAHSGYWSLQ